MFANGLLSGVINNGTRKSRKFLWLFTFNPKSELNSISHKPPLYIQKYLPQVSYSYDNYLAAVFPVRIVSYHRFNNTHLLYRHTPWISSTSPLRNRISHDVMYFRRVGFSCSEGRVLWIREQMLVYVIGVD